VQSAEYEKLAAVEDRMWWFEGAHGNMLAALGGRAPEGVILDAGCGTGGFLAKLTRAFPGRAIAGVDVDESACRAARRKSGALLCRGSVERLPFADGALAAIFSADVLCHAAVDEARTLREFHRCLAGGGLLVLNLPAYPWLLSQHDRAVDNVRRYTRGGILSLLRAAGFAGARTLYWNTVLFPLMVVRRKLLGGDQSDVRLLPAPIEAAFRAVMRFEAALIGAGVRLPFGGSLLTVAVKHG
jgi:SAM-dependent methyltransferase